MVSSKDQNIFTSLSQEDLDSIYSWCFSNVLTVNIRKTQILRCYPIRSPPDLSICNVRLSNTVLKRVMQFNYLGVIIDFHLSFKAQCQKVWSMSRSRFLQLCDIKQVIDQNLALGIYKSMIIPIFDYCDYITESGPLLCLRRQTVQNKMSPTVAGYPRP